MTVLWSLREVIDASLLQPMKEYTYQPACPASNCTWDPFPSLAVCSKCVNLQNWTTDCGSSKKNIFNCSYELPGIGQFPIIADFSGVEGSGPQYLSTTNISLKTSKQILDIGNPIVSFAALTFNRTGSTILYDKPAAADFCSVFYCVQTWNVSVINIEIKNTDIINTWYNNTPTNADVRGQRLKYQNLTLYPTAQDLHLSSSTDVGIFFVSWNALYTLETFLAKRFSGNMTTFRLASGNWGDNATMDDLTRVMTKLSAPVLIRSVALVTTQYLRMAPENFRFRVPGTAILYVPIINVRWLWIIFPVGLLLLSILFLTQTVILSSSKLLWKSSNLVLLFYGPECGVQVGDNRKRSVMENMAKDVKMVVRMDNQTWKLTMKRGRENADPGSESPSQPTDGDELNGGGTEKKPETCEAPDHNEPAVEEEAVEVEEV